MSAAAATSSTDDHFGNLLLQHVAICHDVVLEQTIAIRRTLKGSIRDGVHATVADTDVDVAILLQRLDELLPLRPIESEAPATKVPWADFIKPNGVHWPVKF